MQAVILAAGIGSRLDRVTGGGSKALVDIGGRPLILHTLEALADHGVGPVLVVLGHEADELRDVIGDRAEMLVNERFAETDSLYSLWLTRDWIQAGPLVLLNCDLLFDPRILSDLLNETDSVLAYDSTSSRGHEPTKVALNERRVVDIGKDLPAASARGESLDLLKFDADGVRVLFATAGQLITAGQENACVIEATRIACRQVPIYGVNVAGYPWADIDFPYDLDVARREVWPAIHRARWRRHVRGRRTRWVTLAAVVVAAIAGWPARTREGPASVNSETADMVGGERIAITRAEGDQRWYLTSMDSQVVAAEVSGDVSVQLRLVHPARAADTLRFAVALNVDDLPTEWHTITSIRDTTTQYGELALGDRSRVQLQLAPGTHRVGIRLVAGPSERLLVRIRPSELPDD